MNNLIDKLNKNKSLSKEEFTFLLDNINLSTSLYLFKLSSKIATERFGNKIYIRGLIEFTNYCKNNCYYCGIRAENKKAIRYRLTEEEIMACCASGYNLGFRTFVLQGGEDNFYNDDILCKIVYNIKNTYSDCAVTLSVGERSYDSYKRLFDSGADRYLLRHETANTLHYGKLHPPNLTLENRKKCLYNLKEIGYQVGTGFMVGSPFQTSSTIAEDLLFIKELNPQMVGIGPFIPHKDTPFGSYCSGTWQTTIFLIGILRLMLPNALIPATTALSTISSNGRKFGVIAGANVVMPNLSPTNARKNYLLYDNKICTDEESAQCKDSLEKEMNSIDYTLAVDKGDYKEFNI